MTVQNHGRQRRAQWNSFLTFIAQKCIYLGLVFVDVFRQIVEALRQCIFIIKNYFNSRGEQEYFIDR